MTRLLLPAQNIKVDQSTGVDPIWYGRLKSLTDQVNSLTDQLDLLNAQLAPFIAAGAYSSANYTPVLTSAGGTAPTFTAPALSGLYVKIGQVVYVNISGANTAGGTPGAGTQQLSVTLPFPVRAIALPARATFGSFLNLTTEDLTFGQLTPGASVAALYQQNISGSKANQVALTGADLNNATRAIYWRFYYGVD